MGNFRARIDINSVIDISGGGDPLWEIGGKVFDPTGSFTGEDASIGDRIITRGYGTTGEMVYDVFIITAITGQSPVFITVEVEPEADVQNNSGGPLTGSFPICTKLWLNALLRKPSYFLAQFDPDYETALDNLNFGYLEDIILAAGNVEDGTMQGQVPYWDTGEGKYLHSQISFLTETTMSVQVIATLQIGNAFTIGSGDSIAEIYSAFFGMVYGVDACGLFVQVEPYGRDEQVWSSIQYRGVNAISVGGTFADYDPIIKFPTLDDGVMRVDSGVLSTVGLVDSPWTTEPIYGDTIQVANGSYVGIGTLTPEYNLDVSGPIRTNNRFVCWFGIDYYCTVRASEISWATRTATGGNDLIFLSNIGAISVLGDIYPASDMGANLGSVVSPTVRWGFVRTAAAYVISDNTGTTPFYVTGKLGQTAKLSIWQTSVLGELASINAYGTLSLAGNLQIPYTASSSVGVIEMGGYRFIHAYGHEHSLFIGKQAGNLSNSTLDANLGIGYAAMFQLSSGYGNFAIGKFALYSCTTSNSNFALGNYALYALTTTASASSMMGLGNSAGQNATGANSIFIGAGAGHDADGSNDVIGIGTSALYNNNGYYSVAIGHAALYLQEASDGNVGIGWRAGNAMVSGDYNVFVGFKSGYGTLGSNNILIGANVGTTDAGSNKLMIDVADNGASSLVYGEFDNNLVRVNGNFFVTGYLQMDSDDPIYFGDSGTDGTWKLIRSGNNFIFQRRESGNYVTKQTISA